MSGGLGNASGMPGGSTFTSLSIAAGEAGSPAPAVSVGLLP